jgi:hypothetical protein
MRVSTQDDIFLGQPVLPTHFYESPGVPWVYRKGPSWGEHAHARSSAARQCLSNIASWLCGRQVDNRASTVCMPRIASHLTHPNRLRRARTTITRCSRVWHAQSNGSTRSTLRLPCHTRRGATTLTRTTTGRTVWTKVRRIPAWPSCHLANTRILLMLSGLGPEECWYGIMNAELLQTGTGVYRDIDGGSDRPNEYAQLFPLNLYTYHLFQINEIAK